LENPNQERKRKSLEKTAEDQLFRQDKKLYDILSFMGQLAKDKNSQANFTTGMPRLRTWL
jgi:hypothetical protein